MAVKTWMIMKRHTIAFCALCVVLAGCGTMLGAPDSDVVTIETNPAGANVYSGASLLGKTPLTHTFKRETFERIAVTIRKAGYKNQELLLEKSIEKKALFNLAFITTTFGVTSWGIDAASGRAIKYAPDSYLIDLEKINGPSSQNDPARIQRLRFVVLNQDYLMKNIADGEGDYLRTYFDIKPSRKTSDDYQRFLNRVSLQSGLLLSTHDPVTFYNYLENI
jgi:PEGA domain-containing protein